MRRLVAALVGLTVLLAFAPGGASAAKDRKLVEGTVYEAICVRVCVPECPPPPHCGPIPARAKGSVICAQARIVCPLDATAGVCLRPSECSAYPVYSGEGSLVNVRRRGSATVLARLPIVQGHFKIWLGPGEYVFHPYMAEERCWSAGPAMARVTAKLKSPVPVMLEATNRCVAYAGAD